MKNNTQPLPPIDKLPEHTICILGYGREGRAVEKWLRARFQDKVTIEIFDQAQDNAYIQKLLKTVQDQETHKKSIIVKSAGVPPHLLPETVAHTSPTALFFSVITEDQRQKLIGVTGSKGKSTTASLIAAGLRASGAKVSLVGNIGIPLLESIIPDDQGALPIDQVDWIVAELSSYQLENLHASPAIAVITTLFPEHLDYHGTIDAYYEAKSRIVTSQAEHDRCFFDSTNPIVIKTIEGASSMKIPIPHTLPFITADFLLIGKHNELNMRSAYAVCANLGVTEVQVEQAFKTFVPLPHRLEQIVEHDGVLYIDDAISTTPESTLAGIEALVSQFKDRRIGAILLGGTDRRYSFDTLAKTLADHEIRNIVFFPDSGERIKQAVLHAYQEKNIQQPEYKETRSMDEAVQWCASRLTQGDICLLSTASPSYSIWKNFEAKGDAFRSAIQVIAKS